MGIKGLWNVLSPFCENKPLSELKGEIVAIDLSGWVCDSQNITERYVQPKLYLRNLFFRTSYLLLNDITPLFVLDGDAPQDKLIVMQERNKKQFRGAQPIISADVEMAPKSKLRTDRRRFKSILKECCDLLASLGVQYIAATGEAEQLCARLNANGHVAGVVSSDSDCFAYGAIRVLRNLSPTSVDMYDMHSIHRDTGWGRYKSICMAFLCGCDYNSGLTSSNATAATFLNSISDAEALDRLISWRSSDSVYIKLMKDSKQRIACKPCEKCSHIRSAVSKAKAELKFVEKARAMVDDFPPPPVLEEFLKIVSYGDTVVTTWNRPDLLRFSRIMMTKIGWNERYCVEKLVPLLTGWQLRQADSLCHLLKPTRINRTRKIQGVPCVEVVWNDADNLYTEFVPDDQFEEGESHEILWTTVEPIELFSNNYLQMYNSFVESKKKPKKSKKLEPKLKEAKETTKKKKNSNGPESEKRITKTGNNLSTSRDIVESKENVSDKTVKRKRKKSETKNMKTTKASKKSTLQITLRTFVNNKMNKSYSSRIHDSLVSNDSLCDLSNIINNIIKRRRCNMKYGDMKLVFQKEHEFCDDLRSSNYFENSVHCSTPKKCEGRRLSHFFESFQESKPDDFEVSFNKMVNKTEQSTVQIQEYEIAKLSFLSISNNSTTEQNENKHYKNNAECKDDVYE